MIIYVQNLNGLELTDINKLFPILICRDTGRTLLRRTQESVT